MYFLVQSAEKTNNSYTQGAMVYPVLDLSFKRHLPLKEPDFLKKNWLISGMGQRKYKMNIKHLIMAESEKMLSKKKKGNV